MLIIRADMNKYIATGHIMRCLSIADAAKQFGHDVVFVARIQTRLPLLNQEDTSVMF